MMYNFAIVSCSCDPVMGARDSQDNRIRVAQIITGLVLGGGATVMLSIAKNINKSLFHLDFFCVIEGGELLAEIEKNGFSVKILKVFNSKRIPKYNLFQICRLALLLRRGQYDIVHTHLYKADVSGRLAAIISRTPHIIKTLHNMGIWKSDRQLYVDRLLNFFTDKVICVSDYQRECVEIQEKIPKYKLVTVKNGVDLISFPKPVNRDKYLATMGLDPNKLVVGTVGRLIPEKGQIYLLESIPKILEKHPNTQFIIAGDGPLRETLTTFVKDMPFRDNIYFAGLRGDIPSLLSALDVFVFPSILEAFGIAVIEAMAAKCVVACSAIPQLKEIVTDGLNGLLFEPKDAPSLAGTVNLLLSDRNLRNSLTENAFEMVRGKLTEKHMIETLQQIYVEVINRGAPGGAV